MTARKKPATKKRTPAKKRPATKKPASCEVLRVRGPEGCRACGDYAGKCPMRGR